MVIIILLSFIVSQFIYSTREVSDTIKYLKKVLRGLEPMRYPTGKVLLNIITEYNNRLSNH